MNDPDEIRILLVEDDPQDRYLLTRCLRKELASHHLETSARLSAAQAQLSQDTFDLILLDLGLPDSLGIETFHSMKLLSGDIPIVVLSGHEDEQLAVEAVRLGAQDCIFKNSLQDISLGRALRFAVARATRFHLEDEVLSSAMIPHRLIRPVIPPSVEFEIVTHSLSAGSMAHEEYDCFELEQGQIACALINQHHNNLATSLRLMELRVALRSLGLCLSDPGAITTGLNRVLYQSGESVKAGLHQVTLFLAILDRQTRELSYAAAGGQGFLFRPEEPPKYLSSLELPLGVKDAEFPTENTIRLKTGDVLVLMSRDVTADENEGTRIPSWADTVQQHLNTTAPFIAQSLEDVLLTQQEPGNQDTTILVIRVLAPQST